MRQATDAAPVILNSWKEIAEYLGRGVRTVQRWEHELQLPVRRIGKGNRSPVYTTIGELRFWISTVEIVRKDVPHPILMPPALRSARPIDESRRLLSDVRRLAQALAENSVRQQRQAEILEARILKMRSRMK